MRFIVFLLFVLSGTNLYSQGGRGPAGDYSSQGDRGGNSGGGVERGGGERGNDVSREPSDKATLFGNSGNDNLGNPGKDNLGD
ncbi:hypothetical protein [Pedobacter agri]|uniref:hypothetical protein n=1 Tax=Pedobacter agri TaxID=454586 RepID=UPI0029316EB7|nr:hypothetical protein [Pedobacter agri]